MSGVSLIAAERRRQVEAEGWTPDHDNEHDRGQLISAAMAYCEYVRMMNFGHPHAAAVNIAHGLWAFNDNFKPSRDPIRNLVKAGALIAAEIDRLQREGGRK